MRVGFSSDLAAVLAAGRAARAAGNWPLAAERFRATVLARPAHVAARLDLAQALTRLGQATEAVALANGVLADQPGDMLTLLRLGEALRAMGDLHGALAAFAAAVAANPAHGRARSEHDSLLARMAGAAVPVPTPARTGLALMGRVAMLRAAGEAIAADRLLGSAATSGKPGLWFAATDLAIREGRFAVAAEQLANSPSGNAHTTALAFLASARLAAACWEPEAALRHHTMALAADPSEAFARRTAVERAELYLLALDPLGARAALASADGANRPAALLNEAGIELGVLARLIATRPLPPTERVAPLAALCAAAPEVTLVAASLLLALRRSGGLTLAARPMAPRIPRRIGTLGALPSGAWPSDVVPVVFDDAGAARFLVRRAMPAVAEAFARADPTRRGDLLRLAWLHVEGGLWVGAGARARGDAWPPAGTVLAASLGPGALLGGDWLAAAPGETVIARALAAATSAVLEGAREAPVLATGAGLLTRVFAAEYVASSDRVTWLRERAVLDATAVELDRLPMPIPTITRVGLNLPDLAALT